MRFCTDPFYDKITVIGLYIWYLKKLLIPMVRIIYVAVIIWHFSLKAEYFYCWQKNLIKQVVICCANIWMFFD